MRRRLLAIKYIYDGKSRLEVCGILNCSYTTLSTWIDKYLEVRFPGLVAPIRHDKSDFSGRPRTVRPSEKTLSRKRAIASHKSPCTSRETLLTLTCWLAFQLMYRRVSPLGSGSLAKPGSSASRDKMRSSNKTRVRT
ncbi:MAG: helix-turn-helix domain-containing protein [Hormoscilla sp. GM102CHS1]|nr:helix-turn-helix domain-containing protein [Hormoscilla sp. GM102CHS1]